METLQAILVALVGAFIGIYAYQSMRPQPSQKEVVEIVQEPPVLPYWTTYDPGYGYWPRWLDSYWLDYVPFYGPITGSSSYNPWYGGRPHYLPNHWGNGVHSGHGGPMGGHSGVAVGGGGGHGGHGGGSGGHGGGGGHGGH